jgi:hypothetical protein
LRKVLVLRQAQDEDFGLAAVKFALTLSLSKGEGAPKESAAWSIVSPPPF